MGCQGAGGVKPGSSTIDLADRGLQRSYWTTREPDRQSLTAAPAAEAVAAAAGGTPPRAAADGSRSPA